jgi:3-isopropylmalate/(R)-2-methylmalate dehydratase small subunit
MAKDKFIVLRSTAVPLPIENIDTDQIIPARFLKATTREGFGDNLFRDWRFDASHQPKSDFVLNQPTFHGKILLAGKNFGCGSSREHAAWAIYDYGFRVVISSFFADIFKNNALNNGLLPLVVSEAFLQRCFRAVAANPKSVITIDLPEQTVTLNDGPAERFDMNPYKKSCMINGQDDIDYLLSLREEIGMFDKNHSIPA